MYQHLFGSKYPINILFDFEIPFIVQTLERNLEGAQLKADTM